MVILGGGRTTEQSNDGVGDLALNTEQLLLKDAVKDTTTGRNSVFIPADAETVTLMIGSAAFNARLIDTPYLSAAAKKEFELAKSEALASGQREPPAPKAAEVVECEMGGYLVSVVDCIATGQKVKDGGALVFAPRPMIAEKLDTAASSSSSILNKKTLLISVGDVLLTDLRSQFVAVNMKAEYSTKPTHQQLVVNGKIVIRRDANSGHISIEGPLCEDFFKCRSVIYSMYVMM
jgi:hypothetical protein